MIMKAQTYVGLCFGDLGRHAEALVIEREIYAKFMALRGVAHLSTLTAGTNVTATMLSLKLYDEMKSFLKDRLLPAARRSLGAEHDITLCLSTHLAAALLTDPQRTRGDLRLNRRRCVRRRGY